MPMNYDTRSSKEYCQGHSRQSLVADGAVGPKANAGDRSSQFWQDELSYRTSYVCKQHCKAWS